MQEFTHTLSHFARHIIISIASAFKKNERNEELGFLNGEPRLLPANPLLFQPSAVPPAQ